jgi:uncharacterized protein YwlG (UPF0340 family)
MPDVNVMVPRTENMKNVKKSTIHILGKSPKEMLDRRIGQNSVEI